MKVVLDTNVIIAAFATRGLCAEVFEVCLTKCEIVLSEYILSEVAEKIITKIHLSYTIVHEIIQFLREHAQIVKPELIEISALKDKKDFPIIGTALSGNAQFLITILSTREFWEWLSTV